MLQCLLVETVERISFRVCGPSDAEHFVVAPKDQAPVRLVYPENINCMSIDLHRLGGEGLQKEMAVNVHGPQPVLVRFDLNRLLSFVL